MVAWFDELPMAPVSHFYGVHVEGDDGDWSLEALAMGGRQACRIAHTTLELLAPSAERPTPAGSAEALFVDNACLYGQTPTDCLDAMGIMQQRAVAVGAKLQIESPQGAPEVEYDFLGERFNHLTKERSLPAKHVLKANEMIEFLGARQHGRMSARELFSLMGSTTYGSATLDLDLTTSLHLLQEHAVIARDAAERGSWHHHIRLSTTSQAELKNLLEQMVRNKPVHVTRGAAPPQSKRTIEAFVDASRWGWGAVVPPAGLDGTAGVQHLRRAWTPEEHASCATWPSVCTEPRALRMLLCCIGQPNTHYIVHTDHAPLVWAWAGRRWASHDDYNLVHRMMRELEAVGITVELRFIPGSKNPADPLSRGAPPLLELTSVAGVKKRKREGWDGCEHADVVAPSTALTKMYVSSDGSTVRRECLSF